MSDNRWLEAENHLKNNDETLARFVERVGACTLQPQEDPFEALVLSIVCQQLSVKAANTIWERAKNVLKNEVTPKNVLAAEFDDLRGAGLSRQKATYVKNIAQAWTDGHVPAEDFEKMPDDEVAQALIQIKGVGAWTADMFLIFTLGRPDVLPVGDLSFRNVVKTIYGLDELPEKDALEKIAESWRPWRSIGAWYCWRAMDTGLLNN